MITAIIVLLDVSAKHMWTLEGAIVSHTQSMSPHVSLLSFNEAGGSVPIPAFKDPSLHPPSPSLLFR
jgi:hypothetical protein